MSSTVSRRTLAKGAAWSVPVAAASGTVPVMAASNSGCATKLINVPWSRLFDGTKRHVGNANTYIAYVLYPTSDTSGSAAFTSRTPASATGNANGKASFAPDYCECTGSNNVHGQSVTTIVEVIGGDSQFSDTPKTYNDLHGRPPEGNAWPYLVTQQPDRGQNYEVTGYSAFRPQRGSLDNQYTGVRGTSATGNVTFTWEVTMVAPTCSPRDGANAIEYQLFFPPHYAPAGRISNPVYKITAISPWGVNTFQV